MRASTAALLLALSCASGCASLAVEPDDSCGRRAGKLMARLPLSVLTLSASEFRIQRIESGLEFDAYVEETREKIARARENAAAAEQYDEFRQWSDYADSLEAELAGRLALRAASGAARAERRGSTPDGAVSVGSGGEGRERTGADAAEDERESSQVSAGSKPEPAPALCRSRTEGQAIVTECN